MREAIFLEKAPAAVACCKLCMHRGGYGKNRHFLIIGAPKLIDQVTAKEDACLRACFMKNINLEIITTIKV